MEMEFVTNYQRGEALRDEIRKAREVWYAISADDHRDGQATSSLHERYENHLVRIDELTTAIEDAGEDPCHVLTRLIGGAA